MSQLNDIPPDVPVSQGLGRIALVEAQWHADIVLQAREAFLAEMARQGVTPIASTCSPCPAPSRSRCTRGGWRCRAATPPSWPARWWSMAASTATSSSPHTVVSALMQQQLDTGVPMLSAVLTPHHFHEHIEHRKYFQRHFATKGTEVADACIRTLASLRRVDAMLADAVLADAAPTHA